MKDSSGGDDFSSASLFSPSGWGSSGEGASVFLRLAASSSLGLGVGWGHSGREGKGIARVSTDK